MDIVLIAALDEGMAIGGQNDLLWRLPDDFRHFKRRTLGRPVIMGRKTFESLGAPLKDRPNLVLSRHEDFRAPGARVFGDLDAALTYAREELGAEEAMIGGGATLYEQTLPMADRLILTLVHGRHPGDTFFPSFDSREWEVVRTEFHPADARHALAFTIVELVPLSPAPRAMMPVRIPGAELPESLKKARP
ncbi:dihydrofolate reductase [Lujinxingia litoralis]|uniref:Dihydrofolate reductase n=1 Tax=Lujinxingia litoralis TaxID=2211119 RepID=A0A328C1K3_9DELT|nr:dihydrofolate reductase [Lujinxingia litoralis]RAL20476.1 dihydrofolate reductase [Lujinxingia litoralis]